MGNNMKLTKIIIAQFEQEQKEFGTEVALTNILWQVAHELLKDIGVTKTTTKYEENIR